MRRRNGGVSKRNTSSNTATKPPRRRNSSGKVSKAGSRADGRKSERELSSYRRAGDGYNDSILKSAVTRGTREMGDGIILPTSSEVKEIARNLPAPWGNHRFLLIMVVLGMILVTVGTGLLKSYLVEREGPEQLRMLHEEIQELNKLLKEK